jgi:hypothetical protein
MKSSLLLVLLFFISALNFSQSLNYGLSQPQDKNTLPKSRAAIKFPVPKAKFPPKAALVSLNDNQWEVAGGWELCCADTISASPAEITSADFNSAKWMNAIVPGTVLTTLVERGVYPDPYLGVNNLAIPDSLCRMKWWYRTLLPLPEKVNGKQVDLIFNGINYRAEIWLNGSFIGRIDGAFIRGIFNITDKARYDAPNILSVLIYPPDHPGIPQEGSKAAGRGPNGGIHCADGPAFISSEGWDWIPGIRDRNIGIWQDVRLKVSGGVKIADPFVITDLPLPDTSRASLAIEANIINNTGKTRNVVVAGKIEGLQFTKRVTLKPNEIRGISFGDKDDSIIIKNPRLWWPNGSGRPELYSLKLFITDESGDTLDSHSVRFGVREISYDLTVHYKNRKNVRVEFNPVFALKNKKPVFDNSRSKDEIQNIACPKLINEADTTLLLPGGNADSSPYMVIKVNGRRIFCKGGNWGMDDGMKRVSRARLEPYIRLHKEENFNMLRNWTGESTEEDLYSLCDEYGILVYNEFWYSTEYYNLDPWDNQLFMNNVRDVVKRFRNHPSIALWGARNEGYPSKVLEDSLRGVIALEDRTRLYQPSSTLLNFNWSGPWHYLTNQKEYFTAHAGGFKTELGTLSVPTAPTIRKMMPPEDLWPINDAWYYHDFNYGDEDFLKTMKKYYGEPTGLDDFCRKAQMLNYESHRNMFEGFNAKMWKDASGLLLWMSHPAWPSAIWQTYSWDYETFGSFFGCKKACEPAHIQLNLHDDMIVAVNNTASVYNNAKAVFRIYDVNSKMLFEKIYTRNIPAVSRVDLEKAVFPTGLPNVYLVRLKLLSEKGETISENDYWRKKDDETGFRVLNSFTETELMGRVIGKDSGKILFRVKNNSKTMAVSVKLNLRNRDTDEIILPAYFSDGYFQLLAGEEKELSVEFTPEQKMNYKITCEGYNFSTRDLLIVN